MAARVKYLVGVAALTPIAVVVALGLTPDLALFGMPADFMRGLMVGAVIGVQLILGLRALRAGRANG